MRGKAMCTCPDERTCPQVADAVCGTDGETYLNDCVMKARSCRKGVPVEKTKDGACGKNKFSRERPPHWSLSIAIFLYPTTQMLFAETLYLLTSRNSAFHCIVT